ncbi:MAG: hypothetical protein WCS37_02655 [Chloroflexota bacterium]|nr:hypothetical protein [Chloroflexota bacterium]
MLKNPVFAALGLIFALATLALFALSLLPDWDSTFRPLGIFTLIFGGIFLLLGFNSRSEKNLF